MYQITNLRGLATYAAIVAAGLQAYRSLLEIRSANKKDEKEARAKAKPQAQDPTEAEEYHRAAGAAWRMRLFLQGNDKVFAELGAERLTELQRLRAVYRAGEWALTGLDRRAWAEAGVEQPALAARLASLGVRPHPCLGAPLTEDEAAVVTAVYGRPVSARTLPELLGESDELDGAAAVALVAGLRMSRKSER